MPKSKLHYLFFFLFFAKQNHLKSLPAYNKVVFFMNYSVLHRYPGVVFEITLCFFFLFLFKQLILQFLYWQQSYLKSIYRLEIWRFVFSFHFLRFTRISSNLSTEILKPLFFRLVPLSPFVFLFCFIFLSQFLFQFPYSYFNISQNMKSQEELISTSDSFREKKISFTLYGFRE